ncbi:hypothetical protein KM043_001244 [Ampulex compressa]|nr:hypothetical protein KM043_001244 [Ampulex compressa]
MNNQKKKKKERQIQNQRQHRKEETQTHSRRGPTGPEDDTRPMRVAVRSTSSSCVRLGTTRSQVSGLMADDYADIRYSDVPSESCRGYHGIGWDCDALWRVYFEFGKRWMDEGLLDAVGYI